MRIVPFTSSRNQARYIQEKKEAKKPSKLISQINSHRTKRNEIVSTFNFQILDKLKSSLVVVVIVVVYKIKISYYSLDWAMVLNIFFF